MPLISELATQADLYQIQGIQVGPFLFFSSTDPENLTSGTKNSIHFFLGYLVLVYWN